MEYQPLIWIVLGIVLILLEFAIPGLIVIFFGTSAIVVGLAEWIGMPTNHGIPFIVFSVLTIVQILFVRRYFKSWFKGKSIESKSDTDTEDIVGKQATVLNGFTEGNLRGKIDFRGSNWTAVSEIPLEQGERVIITERNNLTLTIKRIN